MTPRTPGSGTTFSSQKVATTLYLFLITMTPPRILSRVRHGLRCCILQKKIIDATRHLIKGQLWSIKKIREKDLPWFISIEKSFKEEQWLLPFIV